MTLPPTPTTSPPLPDDEADLALKHPVNNREQVRKLTNIKIYLLIFILVSHYRMTATSEDSHALMKVASLLCQVEIMLIADEQLVTAIAYADR